jgi:hypothetical protein
MSKYLVTAKFERELRNTFPDMEFVRITKNSDRCSGLGVAIYWNNGPAEDTVQAFLDKAKPQFSHVRILIATRSQTCPDCRHDVVCSDPTSDDELVCYICGKNGGLEESGGRIDGIPD